MLPNVGIMLLLKNFKPEFPNLNESIVLTFRKLYHKELKQVTKEQREVSNCIPKYFEPTDRLLMLGKIDGMVQTYLRALS